jgi:aryl-alcohol dehydrogenase
MRSGFAWWRPVSVTPTQSRGMVSIHVVLSAAYCGVCKRCLLGQMAYCEPFRGGFRWPSPRRSTSLAIAGERISSHFFGQAILCNVRERGPRERGGHRQGRTARADGPLGWGLQTGAGAVLNELRPEPGSSLVVFGTGAVGCGALMAAKIAGCTTVVAVDIHDSRLELAKELGATHTISSKSSLSIRGTLVLVGAARRGRASRTRRPGP